VSLRPSPGRGRFTETMVTIESLNFAKRREILSLQPHLLGIRECVPEQTALADLLTSSHPRKRHAPTPVGLITEDHQHKNPKQQRCVCQALTNILDNSKTN